MPDVIPTAFTIPVPIKQDMLHRIIDTSIIDVTAYTPLIRSMAGVDLHQLRTNLLSDPVFMGTIIVRLIDAAYYGIDESVRLGDIHHNKHPLILQALAACKQAYDTLNKELDRRLGDQQTKRSAVDDMRDALARAGYTVQVIEIDKSCVA